MSKMYKHAVRAGLWVTKRERYKAVIGNINFFHAIMHGLHTPKGAITVRGAS